MLNSSPGFGRHIRQVLMNIFPIELPVPNRPRRKPIAFRQSDNEAFLALFDGNFPNIWRGDVSTTVGMIQHAALSTPAQVNRFTSA
jgi:hypothetical protein